MRESRKKYLQYLNPLELLQTKKVLQSNPTIIPTEDEQQESQLSLFCYNENFCKFLQNCNIEEVSKEIKNKDHRYWLNLDIINKSTVEALGAKIGLHPLVIEDILSDHQRPKADEMEDTFSIVLQMLYFNDEQFTIEGEQVSFVLKPNLLVSFQDDAARDVFNPIRERLKKPGTKIKSASLDYLLYALLDVIVDNYFIVLEKLGTQIEKLEEEITRNNVDNYTMNRINNLRKELIYFKRSTMPVREMVNAILKTDTKFVQDSTKKYFKDIYDNSLHVNDLSDNYRDVLTSIRDLYLSQANIKMNEVMKFLAIVTTLLAPATVIGGIFGMNFDKLPYIHQSNGFFIASFFMLIIPIFMLIYFRRKGWF